MRPRRGEGGRWRGGGGGPRAVSRPPAARHKDAVVTYLARLSGDRDRAEDLAQDTFLRLFRAARGYTEQGYLRAYLFRIATNLVRSVERRERRLRLLMPFFPREEHAEPAGASGILRRELHPE